MPQRILIVGGGIAGPIAAYWLAKHSSDHITVLERSPHHNQSGQIIDVEGPAQEIITRMGLLDKVRASATKEQGITVVDENNKTVGTFPAGEAAGLSKSIEIMRPKLGEILYEAAVALPNVEFRFGCTVSSLEQTESSVQVRIVERKEGSAEQEIEKEETYDTVIACDGLRSKTRDLIMPSVDPASCIKSLEVFAGFFDIPAQPQDQSYSRLYNSPGRISAFIKPMDATRSSAYLTVCKFDQELHDARESRDVARQKRALASILGDAGWETARMTEAMLTEPHNNFYFEEISQVKLPTWSEDRCVLLGDTAWCPSPLTGQGTSTAILGAYVLAHKLVRCYPGDYAAAFREYEQDLRPYMEKAQSIPLGGRAPALMNPDSATGVWIARKLVGLVSQLSLSKYLPDSKMDFDKMPDF